MTARPQPAADVVERIRTICLGLPEAVEHDAWTGASWRIGSSTFAHVVEIADGWPPAYVAAFGSGGPLTVLTFQAEGAELEALTGIGHPFVRPPWRPGVVGLILADDTDWEEVAELLTDSYCTLAPRRLVALVARPPHPRE